MTTSLQSPLQQVLEKVMESIQSADKLKAAVSSITINYTNVLMFVFFVAFAIYQGRNRIQKAEKAAADRRSLPAPDFPEIKSLPDFEWDKTEPFRQRPFKPKYYLTMALQKLDPSELILMDKNYVDRIKYRKQIMKKYPDKAIAINDEARVGSAIRELYTFLMATYLPKRYPKMFKLHQAHFETGDAYMLENLVTKELHPAQGKSIQNTRMMLEVLGKTLDEEFLFLLPAEDSEDDSGESAKEKTEQDIPKYVLEAYVALSPSGFDTSEKLGKRLADIHTPVPGYKDIIEGSMDRYFAKVKPGEYVKRANWSVTTDPELFNIPSSGKSNHAYEGDEIEQLESIDPEKTWVRSERQTLHRLPKSKALVFAFKTYMYPIKEIKEEGMGEELAQAIDGLREGNAPGMHYYKKGVVWGEAVKEYLRSS